jgi:energy-coupling factor transporter ATP-binding protein EcfA2
MYAFSITIVGFLHQISTWAEIVDMRIHFKDGQLMKCTPASTCRGEIFEQFM